MNDVTLAIIAGGRAERLGGVAKGMLSIGGRTIIESILELSPIAKETILVANDPAPYARLGLRTVPDVIRDRGAPGGVQSALVHASTEWVLAIAADMPLVKRSAVDRLLREPACDVAAFEVAGRPEPLLARYRRALAATWAAMLSAQPSFREIYARIDARLIPETELRALDPELRSVVSINTPEDVARYGLTGPPANRPDSLP